MELLEQCLSFQSIQNNNQNDFKWIVLPEDITLDPHYYLNDGIVETSDKYVEMPVFRQPLNIHLQYWPLELWEVQILEFSDNHAAEEMIMNAGNQNRSTSALRIQLLKNHPADSLFGKAGKEVVKVLDTIPKLTPEQVDRLASTSSMFSKQAYVRTWRRWLEEIPNADNVPDHILENLYVYGGKVGGSPVNQGLRLISLSFRRWASLYYSEFAFEKSSSGKLKKNWHLAQRVLAGIALAHGMRERITKQDFELLVEPSLH